MRGLVTMRALRCAGAAMRFGVPSESLYRAYARVPFVSLFRLVPATLSHGVQGHRPASFAKIVSKKKRGRCVKTYNGIMTRAHLIAQKQTEWQKEASAE